MALKHSWTPFQGYIINALKKHLLLNKTYTEWFYNTAIQRGMILMMEHLSLEPDLPLTWEKICRNKTKATHKNLELLLTQAAATVFSGQKYVLEGIVYDQVGKLLLGGVNEIPYPSVIRDQMAQAPQIKGRRLAVASLQGGGEPCLGQP